MEHNSKLKSILSHRGYSIAKSGLDPEVLQHYKNDLTITPHVEREEYAFNIKPIKLYAETDKRFYMPRYYGMKQLGEPETNKLEEQIPDKICLTPGLTPRENQKPVIEKTVRDLKTIGGGVLSLPCAFGKTGISLFIASILKVKTMVVSHTTSLMEQWVERIEQFLPGARVGLVQQNTAEIDDVDIIIASLKTLAIKDFGKNFFSSVGLVVWDEIHLMCTNTFSQAFPKCAVKYTLGLSATPFRKDRCDIIFQHFIGPVLYLLKRPKDSVITAQCVTLMIPEKEIVVKYDRRGKVMYSSTLSNVINNPKRTNRIVEMVVDHAVQGRKILILGEYIKHLKDIMKGIIKKEEEITAKTTTEVFQMIDKMLKYSKLGVELPEQIRQIIIGYLPESTFSYGLYIGEMDNESRKDSETKDVILGTYKLASVGMDIPHLNTLLMASPRKEIEQSVGRILRKKAGADDHQPLIIDIIDNHGVFSSQARVRKQFYKEYGYTIEHIRMEPVTGKITNRRIVTTNAEPPKIELNKRPEGQTALESFNFVPKVSLDTPKKPKIVDVTETDECLLESSEE